MFSSPKKKQPHHKWITEIDNFTAAAIRRKIYTYHTTCMHMSLKNLFQKLDADDLFHGSKSSLHTILRRLGFKWRKTEDNRRLLIETTRVKALRMSYLRKIKKYREENRYIVYLDETYVQGSHTNFMQWSDTSTSGLKKPISKGQRLIIVHAGGKNGFIPNGLLIFKSGTKSGDYHDEMNSVNFQKYIQEKMIPNFPRKQCGCYGQCIVP